jgi:hypothetical protein
MSTQRQSVPRAGHDSVGGVIQPVEGHLPGGAAVDPETSENLNADLLVEKLTGLPE